MRVVEVAELWGISERSVYRLIRSGVLPAQTRIRASPIIGYDVENTLVMAVKNKQVISACDPSPESIKVFIQEVK